MRHGSALDPPNRFDRIHTEADLEQVAWDTEYLRECDNRSIEFIEDTSRSIVSENTSPDVPFRYSINPYRGCIHACSYCYARPGHEFLGFNAGRDFETKIVIKRDAASLLRDFLAREDYEPETIVFSGVTDCYQPAERRFRLTRQCIEVAHACRQPVGIITKNALVVRDIDLLKEMGRQRLARVFVSVTTLEPDLASTMEPRTSIPNARLRTIRELSAAGIPTGVMVAPVIPGLNDSEIPRILEAARDAGASMAGYVMLRLPLTVEPVFQEWIQREYPDRAERVLGRIRQAREGNLNSALYGERMRGTGIIANQIGNMFQLFRQRYELNQEPPAPDLSVFQRPLPRSGQMRLFDQAD